MPWCFQAFRGCDKLQLLAILKVPETMFGWDCIRCRDIFLAATISTMMEVATLEALEQNWQKSEWYSFYSIIYIHHVYNLLA